MDEQIRKDINEDLLSKSFNLYDIHLKDARLIKSNSNFVYDCGDKILRLTHSTIRNEKDIQLELAWINYLRRNDLPVVRIVDSIMGRNYELVGSKNKVIIVCFEKIYGDKVTMDKWSAKHFNNLGVLLGKLHEMSRNYNVENDYKYKNWNELIEHKIIEYLPNDDRQLNKLFRRVVDEIEHYKVTEQNYGVIHYDIHHGNYLLVENQIVLFDFEITCRSWFMNDITTVLYYACQTQYAQRVDNFESTFMKSFWEGYESISKINEVEKLHMDNFLLYRDLMVYGYLYKVWDIDNLDKQKNNYLRKIEKSIEGRTAKWISRGKNNL